MPKIVDHDLYRKELLSQCFDLFAEKGYAAITMRQIADGLGVSTGTLYHYFPSKEALFEQLLLEMAQQDILDVSAELAHLTDVRDRIEKGFAYLERNHEYFFKQLLVFVDYYQQLSRDSNQGKPKPINILERVCDQMQQFITDVLGFPDREITNVMFSFVDGLCLSAIYGEQDSRAFQSQTQLMTKMILAYLEVYEPTAMQASSASSAL
jgi:AcrR family transcriptional regulator